MRVYWRQSCRLFHYGVRVPIFETVPERPYRILRLPCGIEIPIPEVLINRYQGMWEYVRTPCDSSLSTEDKGWKDELVVTGKD